jgi:hypothetical protein
MTPALIIFLEPRPVAQSDSAGFLVPARHPLRQTCHGETKREESQ